MVGNGSFTREIAMLVVMKIGDKNYIKKKTVVAILIDREEDLFLCSLKALQEWRMVVYYE